MEEMLKANRPGLDKLLDALTYADPQHLPEAAECIRVAAARANGTANITSIPDVILPMIQSPRIGSPPDVPADSTASNRSTATNAGWCPPHTHTHTQYM
eukprot:scaffold381890_cov47-Prasinocladus_malaysianus.AAC.1